MSNLALAVSIRTSFAAGLPSDRGHRSDERARELMHVVICGGGAIGCSIAYFLSRRGAEVTVVERTGVANAASGKSGGFLALDWCDGGPLQHLARRSFALHAELAETLGGEAWNYRRMTTYGGLAGYSVGSDDGPVAWVSDSVAIGQRLGVPETTAQVHPGAFTRAMMQAAEANGATLIAGAVTGIPVEDGRAAGVAIDGETLAADAVVVALGPWSILAAEWLPLPPVFGLKGHSLVFETGDALPAEALFLETATAPRTRRSFRAATGQPMSAAIAARRRSRSTRPMSSPRRSKAPSSRRSAGTSRRSCAMRRSAPARPATGR